MYRKFVTPIYVLNTMLQSLFSLVTPIALTFFVAWCLVSYAGVGTWIYVLLIIIGVLSGLYSMVTFILRSMAALEALEAEHRKKDEEIKAKSAMMEKNETELSKEIPDTLSEGENNE